MRIVAGEWRGRRILVPGSGTRPTADRVRQILYDILGVWIAGGRVLDLYAGSGALGLEALSRGAAEAVFVESSRAARAILERNLDALGASARCRILAQPACGAIRRLMRDGERFRLVLADPPYGEEEALRVLALLGPDPGLLLESGGRLVVESGRSDLVPDRYGMLERLRRRDVGGTTLHFFGVGLPSGSAYDSHAAAREQDRGDRSAGPVGGCAGESGVSSCE